MIKNKPSDLINGVPGTQAAHPETHASQPRRLWAAQRSRARRKHWSERSDWLSDGSDPGCFPLALLILSIMLVGVTDKAIVYLIKRKRDESGANSKREPTTTVSELAMEMVRGVGAGVVLFTFVIVPFLPFCWGGSTFNPDSDWLLLFIAGSIYATGIAAGVYDTGKLFFLKGSLWLTFLGAVLGAALAVPPIILTWGAGPWWLLFPLILPPTLAILGFNLRMITDYPELVLTGHKIDVRSVAFSPDGQTLASASSDRTILLWDVASTNTAPILLTGHQDSVLSVAFSPDGQTLASASSDGTIRLWDAAHLSAAPIVLTGHETRVWDLAFSTDGQTLASASSDGTIRLWDVAHPSATPVVLSGHRDRVLAVAFAPDGETLASAGWDKILLWEVTHPGAVPITLTSQGHAPIAFSTDGRILASADRDKRVRLWDVSKTGADPDPLRGYEDGVESVAFSADGKHLAVGSSSESVRLWNLGNPGSLPQELRGHKDGIYGVTFSPDGQTLASAGADGTIRLWDVGAE